MDPADVEVPGFLGLGQVSTAPGPEPEEAVPIVARVHLDVIVRRWRLVWSIELLRSAPD